MSDDNALTALHDRLRRLEAQVRDIKFAVASCGVPVPRETQGLHSRVIGHSDRFGHRMLMSELQPAASALAFTLRDIQRQVQAIRTTVLSGARLTLQDEVACHETRGSARLLLTAPAPSKNSQSHGRHSSQILRSSGTPAAIPA
jgi:hypothetical protein